MLRQPTEEPVMSAPRGNPRQPARPGGDPGEGPPPQFDKELAVRLTGLVRGTGGESRTTLAPFTGEALADLPVSTVDDVAAAFDSARRVQRLWAGTPVRERARVLLRLHDLERPWAGTPVRERARVLLRLHDLVL